MRRVVCTEWGPPEALQVIEESDPTPGPGQVMVEVEAAGVNFVDALFVQGTYQIKIPPPFTPGSELAGVVQAVGAEVTDVQVGQRVLASLGLGTWATHLVVDARAVTPLPGTLDAGRGAALVQSYSTAWFALTYRTTVQPGESVLVLGAGGGVGLAAIDVANALGARVIAAASTPPKRAAASAMGASSTISYEDDGVDLKAQARELAGGHVDVVVDPVGGCHSEAALRATGLGGRFLVIGFAAGTIPALPTNQVLLNNRSVLGVDWGAWAMKDRAGQRALLDDVLAAVADGRLHPPAPTERPLAEAGAVLRDLVGRRVQGKCVLVP